jgi:hypothetical protein
MLMMGCSKKSIKSGDDKIIRLATAPVKIVFIVESESPNFHTNPLSDL